MNKIILFLALLMIPLIINTLGCKNKNLVVIADEPTRVYSEFPAGGIPKEDKVIAILQKGQTATFLYERYEKDFTFYKIRLKDGREGYVWLGDKFRILKNHKGQKSGLADFYTSQISKKSSALSGPAARAGLP